MKLMVGMLGEGTPPLTMDSIMCWNVRGIPSVS